LPKNGYEIVTKNGKLFHRYAHARAVQRSAQHARAHNQRNSRAQPNARAHTQTTGHAARHIPQRSGVKRKMSNHSAAHHTMAQHTAL